MLGEVEVEPVELSEALLLEGKLHEVELSGHFAVLQWLTVHVLYLRLDHPLDRQVLLLVTVSLGMLAVHSRHQLALPSTR